MAKSANSSNEEITKFSQCQNCKRYFEMEISLQDHFQNNEKCKQNHNREQQIIYIECPGPCTKKTYFKFGKSIEMHLKKSKCSKEVPSTFLPRLKKEFQEFKIERRKLSKHRYYLQTKSKRQKTTPPSPPLSEKGKKNEDSARDGESSDDDSSENGNATENSDTSDNETSGHENETEAFKDLAKKNKKLNDKAYSFGQARTETTIFKTEKDRHASIQRKFLKKFDDKIRYQFNKKGFTRGNRGGGGGPSNIKTPFQASEITLALKEKCLWKIDDDCSYASDEFDHLKKEGKKLYANDFYILQDKHEVFLAKQNTLKNLLSKIQQTSDDPNELSKLVADVDEELKISDDLMFRTLHLRQKYISDEGSKRHD